MMEESAVESTSFVPTNHMKRFALSLLAGAVLLASIPAYGAQFRSGETVALSVPISDDLYVSGGTITIHQNVNGDLFVVGGTVDVQNSVSQDVNIAGGNVTLVSQVGDDVRVAGGEVVIRGTITGDLFVAGGNVTIGKDARVLGNAYVAGGNLTVRGAIGKDTRVDGGSVMMEGIVHGDLEVHGGKVAILGTVEGDATLVAQKLNILSGASFKGAVAYWSETQNVDFGTSLASGQQATYHPEYGQALNRAKAGAGAFVALAGVFAIMALLSTMLIIGLLVISTKTFFVDAAKVLRRKPGMSFLLGLAWIVVMPVLALLLLVSVIGIPLAFVALFAYLLVLFFATAFSSLVFAQWMQARYEWKWNRWKLFGTALLIFIALKIIGLIPIIGWIVKGVLVLMALGALLMTKWSKLKKIA